MANLLHSLLLSSDDDVIRVLRRVLNDLEIEVEVCTAADRAIAELSRRKFDAVIIDCDDVPGAVDVLRDLRKLPSNKTSTAFAIINGVTSVRDTFSMGANLTLEKPITLDRARHSFRTVHGMMLQERRRYYRHEIDMAVTLRWEEHRSEVLATAFNLSEGGMAIKVKSSVPETKALAMMKFILPGTHDWIETRGSVAWADGQGHVGIRFENLPYTVKEALERWFNQKLHPEKKPVHPPKPARKSFF